MAQFVEYVVAIDRHPLPRARGSDELRLDERIDDLIHLLLLPRQEEQLRVN